MFEVKFGDSSLLGRSERSFDVRMYLQCTLCFVKFLCMFSVHFVKISDSIVLEFLVECNGVI